MTTVVEYKIFCLTEGKYITGLAYAPLDPVCPHGSNHCVKGHTLTLIREINTSIEESTNIFNSQVRGWELSVPGGTGSTGLDITFDQAVAIQSLAYIADPDLRDDYIDAYILPNPSRDGLIGTLSQDAKIGENTIHVTENVIDLVQPFFRIILNDGKKKQEMGEIKSVNKDNRTLTFHHPISIDFKKGTAVHLLIHRINHYYLATTGKNTIKESSFPSNLKTRLVYNNVNAKAKKFRFFTELKHY